MGTHMHVTGLGRDFIKDDGVAVRQVQSRDR